MGLYISAINTNISRQRRNRFFNKWHLPQEIASKDDEAIVSFLEDACYESKPEKPIRQWRKRMAEMYNIPKRHERVGMIGDKPNYYDLTPEQNAGSKALSDFDSIKAEVDEYNIGYGGFSFVRHELAPYCGAKYFYSEHYTEADGWYLKGKPKLSSLMFNMPSNWDNGSTINKEGMALCRFFLHSDCDGEFSEADIHLIAKFFLENKVRSRVAKSCTSNWKPELLEFLDFTQRCAKQPVYWHFA